MYCNSVAESYHPENVILKIFDTTPEPYTIVRLNLHAYQMLYDPNAPLLLQIWSLTQDFILKIAGEVVAHLSRKERRNARKVWCTRQDSNLRPPDPKSGALSN
jgi:hypothetical protein